MSEFGFEDFTGKLSVDVPVPAKCNGCPIQCELKSQIAELVFAKHLATVLGGSLIGESGERFDEILDEHLPEDAAEAFKRNARDAVSRGMDDIDHEIEATTQEINANALSCEGNLKMRAAKGDVSYTVSVCTSARVHLRDGGPQHLPAHIQADSTSN